MQKTITALLLGIALACAVPAALVAGCTDPISNLIPDLSVVDAAPDLTALVDLSSPDFAGISCGTQTCSGSQVCCITDLQSGNPQAACTTAAACTTNGGVAATCDGPEDCATAGQACCANVELQGGGDAGATSGSGTAECKASCNFSIAGDYRSAQTKLCHLDSDCAGYQGNLPFIGTAKLDKCCHAAQAAQVHFCAQPIAIAGFNIVCP